MASRQIAFFPLLGLPLFTIACIAADLMHAGDLGVVQYLLGNVLFDIFRELGGTEDNFTMALAHINFLMLICSRALEMALPVTEITMGMIRAKGSKPKLKVKAAEGRNTLKVVAYMLPSSGFES